MEEKIRKWRNTQRISGIGIIFFSLWSIIKFLMIMFVRNDTREALATLPMDDPLFRFLFVSIIVILIGADFLLRLKVGLSAMAVSRGERRSAFYLVIDALIIIGSIITVALTIYSFKNGMEHAEENLLQLIVEGTALYMEFDLLRSAVGIMSGEKKTGDN